MRTHLSHIIAAMHAAFVRLHAETAKKAVRCMEWLGLAMAHSIKVARRLGIDTAPVEVRSGYTWGSSRSFYKRTAQVGMKHSPHRLQSLLYLTQNQHVW